MTPPLEVKPVLHKADLEAFIRFPFRLHAQEPHWVPPLLMERREFYHPDKNPLFEYAQVRLFAALRGGQVAGTVAAVRNDRYGQFHPEDAQVGFFGAFECVPEQAVADALLDAAGRWLKEQGKRTLRGPVNLTTNDVVGLLVEGFEDDPALMMPYNPPYYADLLQAAGCVKVKDLHAYELTYEEYRGRLDQVAARLLRDGRIRLRPVDLGRWKEELEFVRACYNVAWAANWGFVPWTDRELDFIARELKPLVDPRLALVVEVDGTPAGFIIAAPDANEAIKLARGRLFPFGLARLLWKLKVAKCSRLRTIAMGILPQYRRRGLDALLVHQLATNALGMGYRKSEMGWVLEDNLPMRNALDQIKARRTKTYRVYDRDLEPISAGEGVV
jgi:GNAT superfamily N-acetyltransferase